MDPCPERPQPVGDRLDAIRSLDAQLTRAENARLAARVGGQQRNQRQLVDETRHLLGSDLGRDELAGLNLHRRNELAADAAPLEDRDARTHPLEHAEQPGPAQG